MNRRPSEWLKFVKMYVDDGIPMTKIAYNIGAGSKARSPMNWGKNMIITLGFQSFYFINKKLPPNLRKFLIAFKRRL